MNESTRGRLREELDDPEARHDYAELFLNSSIALQIKALRLQRGWSQEDLAARADLHQAQILAMEQVSHSSWNLESLQKIAKAFDLSLRVSFETFGTLLNDYVEQDRSSLERSSFADDPAFAEAGKFRPSPFIDFNTGRVLVEPQPLADSLPQPRSTSDWLRLFQARVDVWQLGPAVQMLKQMESRPRSTVWFHSAYALLHITISYFELIGKIIKISNMEEGRPPKFYVSGKDATKGFCDVFPEIDRQFERKHIKDAVKRLRNGLYHLGYTKNNLTIDRFLEPKALDVSERKGQPTVYRVDPHYLLRRVVQHLPSFLDRIKNSKQLEKGFITVMEQAFDSP